MSYWRLVQNIRNSRIRKINYSSNKNNNRKIRMNNNNQIIIKVRLKHIVLNNWYNFMNNKRYNYNNIKVRKMSLNIMEVFLVKIIQVPSIV
jgi:hypothetical protein